MIFKLRKSTEKELDLVEYMRAYLGVMILLWVGVVTQQSSGIPYMVNSGDNIFLLLGNAIKAGFGL